jgi:C-terminal processing protease CtpA/Prc
MHTAWIPALFLAAIAVAQESAPSRPSSRGEMLGRSLMESELALLESAIREKWSYLEDREKNHGVNLAALMTRARSSLRDAMTKAAFHQVVLELVAGLKDGHASVFTPGVPKPQRSWPLRVEETPEGFVIVETKTDLARLGDRVTEIGVNGKRVEDAVADLMRTTFASTDGARRQAAIRRLHETDTPTIQIILTRQPGVFLPIVVETVAEGSAESRSAAGSWSVEFVADGVARLRVRSFTVDNWQAWLAAPVEKRDELVAANRARIDACFEEIGTPRALVLDLRGNPGGTDLLGIQLAKHLLPKKFVYFGLSAKKDGKWPDPHRYEHDPFPADQRFDGPLAILIDERCFSVTDNVLRAIVENRDDVILVGRQTNGGTGAPREIAKLPASETSVTACTMRVYGPKGELIEGRGTVPTIPVRWTAADFIEKRDPDLAAALQALRGVETRASTK